MPRMQMDSPQAPLLARRPSRVQGPRPCSAWSSRSSRTESSEERGWTNVRGRSISSHSSPCDSRLSLCSSSTSSSTTDRSSTFDDVRSWSRNNYSHRRKPAGPRSPHRPRPPGLKQAPAIDAPVRLGGVGSSQTTQVSLWDASRSQTSKSALVPFSPTNNFLLDWDLIFRVLYSFNVSQVG